MRKRPSTQNGNDGAAYPVGYSKPPEASRFTPGRSGNPKGRPKSARNRTTILNQTLNERVIVTEHGRRKSITKQEAIFKQLVNKAAAGDHRAAQLVIGEIRALEATLSSTEIGREIIDEADQQVFDNFLKRLGKRGEEDGNDNDPNCR
jgi:Family of unknown function (DUF5681)